MLGLRGYDPVVASMAVGPLVDLGIYSAVWISFLIKHTKASHSISISAMCFTAGSVKLAATPIRQTYWRLAFGVQSILAWALDFSFPAASILVSNFLPMEHQAFVSTVEKSIYDETASLIKSYRAAMYFGIGVAFLSIVVTALVFVISEEQSPSENYTGFRFYYTSPKKNKARITNA